MSKGTIKVNAFRRYSHTFNAMEIVLSGQTVSDEALIRARMPHSMIVDNFQGAVAALDRFLGHESYAIVKDGDWESPEIERDDD